jgi:hypothetical protein
MNDETLTKLSEVLHRAFHAQKWISVIDYGEGSDENRLAWKNCVIDVIKAYEKEKWLNARFGK